jgi:nicotinate-nucleotide pyrophosphorylase (carboxylating)
MSLARPLREQSVEQEAGAFDAELFPMMYDAVVRGALHEDLGRAGDITTDSVIDVAVQARARIVARTPGRVAGLAAALSAFSMLDPALEARVVRPDGADVLRGQVLATVEGAARPILAAERTALNLLGRLCGIATATRDVVAAIADHRARITCTRTTTPGLRGLEKYAIRVGGGVNHRFGLDDAVLIKDNHLVVAGGIAPAVARARARLGHMVKIEVEVDTLDQLAELLPLGVDAVLLDNMPPDVMRRAVEMVDGRMVTEASGGITPENVRAVAAAGVDMISLGWLTHGAASLNVALDVEIT